MDPQILSSGWSLDTHFFVAIPGDFLKGTERTVKMWHQGRREKRFGPQIAPLDKIKENMPL